MDLSLIGQHCAECGAPIRPGQAVCEHCQAPTTDPIVDGLASQVGSNGASVHEYAAAGGCRNIASATLMLHALEEGERDAPLAATCLKGTSNPAVLRELVVLLATRRWLNHAVSSQLFESSRGPLAISNVIREMFSSGGDVRRGVLLECLNNSSDQVREAAADLLQYSRGPEMVAPLVKALRSDRDPTVRARAAYALGHARDSSCVGELIHALHDSSPLVQSRAAQSLSRLGSAAVSPAANSLETGSPEVALQSARLLGQMGSPEA
ncbi:MAG: HEAT repeat domain-containing protein, partial [Chloroflexi bacterium]|nr:HEAT repeat domain-containing protein [Chloroflexota bacterium]